jgi:uncharacterized protein (TIGR02594 family)
MLWLEVAKKYIGQSEIKGSRHNPLILKWWAKIRAPFTDDETPWCAAFVGGVLEECGIRSSRSAAARSYLKWGQALKFPIAGCVVVFWRGKPDGWSGHVGFVVGRDARDNLLVMGGNQGNAVTVAPFYRGRVLGYRWPLNEPLPQHMDLPIIASTAALSQNEE